ncbi:MAG: hypothetical protein WC915_02070 [archaeon]|jgi:hypothetical protein
MENKYAIILLVVTTLLFVYARLTWLALLTFIITIILITGKKVKNTSTTAWDEFKNAKTTDGSKRIKGYIDNAAKLTAENLTAKQGTKMQLTSPTKIQKGSKTFIDELKSIFK